MSFFHMIFSKARSLRTSFSILLWVSACCGTYGSELKEKRKVTYNDLLKSDEETSEDEIIEAEPEPDIIGNYRESIGSIKFNLIKTPSSAAGGNAADKLLPPYKELNQAFKKIIVDIPQDRSVQRLLKTKKSVSYYEDRKVNKALKKMNINVPNPSKLNPILRKRIPVKYETFTVKTKQKDIKRMTLYDLLKHILCISSDHDPVAVQRCPANLVLLIHHELQKYLKSNIEEIQQSKVDTILKEVLGVTYYTYFKRQTHWLYTNPGYAEYKKYLLKVCEENINEYQYYDDTYGDDAYLADLSVPDAQEEVIASSLGATLQRNSHTLFIGFLVAGATMGAAGYGYYTYKGGQPTDLGGGEGKPTEQSGKNRKMPKARFTGKRRRRK